MPKLTIEGFGEYDIPAGKRLTLALTDEAKIDQHHACGGFAKCTTCRVEFVAGEPVTITEAEVEIAGQKGLDKLPHVRLSCQVNCDHDMTIKILSRAGTKNPGNRVADTIEPAAVWVNR